jgi:transposase
MVYQIEGTLASSLAARQARIDQHRCVILATNELDATPLPPPQLLEGYKGQMHAERGCRFLKDPEFLAASLDRKKPERIIALLMGMPGCLLVYAALESRIRQALQGHDATFPTQSGKRVQNPTARWVFHDVMGIHLLIAPGQWPIVLHLTDEPRTLLHLLGKPYMAFDGVKYS